MQVEPLDRTRDEGVGGEELARPRHLRDDELEEVAHDQVDLTPQHAVALHDLLGLHLCRLELLLQRQGAVDRVDLKR